MVHLLAAAGVADAASKILNGAASAWKHIEAGGDDAKKADAKKAGDPGSFASLLAGLPGHIPNPSSRASHGSVAKPGAIDRVA